MNLSAALRKIRKLSGVTQNEMSARIKKTRQHIGQIERGITIPSYEVLVAYLDVCGYSLAFRKVRPEEQEAVQQKAQPPAQRRMPGSKQPERIKAAEAGNQKSVPKPPPQMPEGQKQPLPPQNSPSEATKPQGRPQQPPGMPNPPASENGKSAHPHREAGDHKPSDTQKRPPNPFLRG